MPIFKKSWQIIKCKETVKVDCLEWQSIKIKTFLQLKQTTETFSECADNEQISEEQVLQQKICRLQELNSKPLCPKPTLLATKPLQCPQLAP